MLTGGAASSVGGHVRVAGRAALARRGAGCWAVVLGLGASGSAQAERERWAEVLLVWAGGLGLFQGLVFYFPFLFIFLSQIYS